MAIGHRAALLHVAECPSCLRQLVNVLLELTDEPVCFGAEATVGVEPTIAVLQTAISSCITAI